MLVGSLFDHCETAYVDDICDGMMMMMMMMMMMLMMMMMMMMLLMMMRMTMTRRKKRKMKRKVVYVEWRVCDCERLGTVLVDAVPT